MEPNNLPVSIPVSSVLTSDFLIASKRWLVRDSKKRPFYPNGQPRQGKLDTAEDMQSLGTLEEAKWAIIRSNGRFVGLGFALGPDGTGNYWQGIDIDDLPAELLPEAADALIGYVERSPSGNGLHALGYGKRFPALGSNGTGFEAYSEGRYFTVTGMMFYDAPLTCLARYVEECIAPLHDYHNTVESRQDGIGHVAPTTISELRSALHHMRSDDYGLWIRMGLALRELGQAGRGLWMEWSSTSDKFNAKEASKKWDSFQPSKTGYQAVFAEAQRQGWINPSSNAAQLPRVAAPTSETGLELLERLCINWHTPDDVEVPDLIADLIADEDVTLLGGHGGVGKSFLALQMACAVALGEEMLGHSARQSRVLYYSAEDGRKRLTRRLRSMERQFGYDAEKLKSNLKVIDACELEPLYGETTEPSSDGKRFVKLLGPRADFASLQRMAEAFDPQLVVIDGASDAFDGNEIVRREVRAFIKMLRRVHPARKVGVLLLVHIDRSSARGHASNDDGYAGSTAWHNSCRRRIFLQYEVKKSKDDSGEMAITEERFVLRVMKNQDGQPAPDMELLRDESGLWRLGICIDIDALTGASQDHASAIARLIKDYYARGTFISTSLAPNAPTGAYATLKDDPQFPRRLSKKRTIDLVRGLERDGVLSKEPYQRANRGWAERWKVTREL